MDNIFPFIDAKAAEINEALPLYKEIDWDFENNKPKFINGNFSFVVGNEAIKVWAYKALTTERFVYIIYSWDFGHEFDSMIGQVFTNDLVKSEVARFLEEALLINPYISGISNIRVDFYGDKIEIEAMLSTIYGEVRVSVWEY